MTLTEGFVLCSKTLPQSSVLTGFSEDHIFVSRWCWKLRGLQSDNWLERPLSQHVGKNGRTSTMLTRRAFLSLNGLQETWQFRIHKPSLEWILCVHFVKRIICTQDKSFLVYRFKACQALYKGSSAGKYSKVQGETRGENSFSGEVSASFKLPQGDREGGASHISWFSSDQIFGGFQMAITPAACDFLLFVSHTLCWTKVSPRFKPSWLLSWHAPAFLLNSSFPCWKNV